MKYLLWAGLVCFGGLITRPGVLAAGLTGADIGAPNLAGSVQTNADATVMISAAGSGFTPRRDQGHFAWLEQTGDFDVAVRLESLASPDLFGRAGIMARTSLDPDSAYVGALATPSAAGILFQAREASGGTGRQTGALPVNYPQTWLRLQRTGDVFTAGGSIDGATWVKLDSASLGSPASVYLGLAVTSWSSNRLATAVFADWAMASGPFLPAATPAVELPGPSSRRTGLVISEIMYHPAPRIDGRSMEFTELYNSQSIAADVSGFRLSGAVDFTFPTNTVLPAGGFIVVARAPDDIRAVYGITNVMGGYAAALGNRSGTVRLLSRIGAVLLEARYDSQPPWPASADGAGHSLVLARPSYGERNIEAWAASSLRGGSPGRWDPVLSHPLTPVVINEVAARSVPPASDYIELYNRASEPADLSGAFLSDNLTLSRFRVPNGTVAPAHGFVQFGQAQLGFALSSEGETVYLTAPDSSRVLDAVRFGAMPVGKAYGRSPDGSSALRLLAESTPGTTNAGALPSDIVLNELMYSPISGDNDDQFVELFNRGAGPVNLGGWQFTSGIAFAFPPSAVLPAQGYLVVARNAARLLARYPDLTPAVCLGDFQGSLAGSGERVTLSRPETVTRTAGDGTTSSLTVWYPVAEVDYRGGGRWGQWSDSGGSSLELIDARADASLASNWADSDETGKGQWTIVEHTGVLDLGDPTYGPTQFQMLLDGPGECLVDNIEVIGPGATNMVTNGDFENGLTGWTLQGSHRDSTLEPGRGVDGSQCLHLRAESRGDPGANRIRGTLATGLKEGVTATLRARVRWLKGFPEFLLRLRGNYLEAVGSLDPSTHLGTPGAPNSRRVTNAPPAIYDVTHSPVLPAADQPVVVTARVNDPGGISQLVLRYRVDPSPDVLEAAMRDDGAGSDAVPNDGLFSGVIPGQPAGTIVAFHLFAADAAAVPASGTFPSSAPVKECLVRFGELQPGSTFGTYRIWMTQATRARWTSREKLNNAPLDVTFVYGNQRVIYNAGALYTGSPFVSSGYSGPTGALCGYALRFPEDDLFLGISDMKLDWPVRDNSQQMEQVAYWIADELGIPSNHRRFVHLYVNGARRGVIYEDAQQPNSDMVAQYFPDDQDGDLYKIDDWFEFGNSASTDFMNRDATLDDFTTTGGEKKMARYRWNWRKRAVQQSASDYRSLFALVDAAHPKGFENFTPGIDALVDVKEYLGVVALEHIVGNWDSFGFYRGKNMFTYKPARGRWNLLMWDIDFVLSASGYPTDTPFFSTIDQTVSQMMYNPQFQRVYYRILDAAANGPLQSARFGPVLTGNYASLIANGVTASLPNAGSNYLNARLKYIRQQLAEVQSPFALAETNQTISSPINLALIQGTAPIQVEKILANGVAYPITWTDATHWQMQVPLAARSNILEFVAVDEEAQPVVGAKAGLTIEYTGPVQSPEGQIVFNEIMYRPAVANAEFIELHNTSLFETFDLSGWQVRGLDYTFAPGTLLQPGAYLVVARDRTGFWQAYGPDTIPAGVFDGNLAGQGETLQLIRPGGSSAEDVTVAEVSYGAQPPWPQQAASGGVSLQLRDPLQDQNRVGNWASRTPETEAEWKLVSVTGTATASRLLVYLSGLPPIRDLTTIEGSWDGYIQGNLSFGLEFRHLPDGGWQGDFIYQLGADEQRITLPHLSVTNGTLVFGFTDEKPEFTFPFTGEPMTLSGRYQPPGDTTWPAMLKRTNPGGDVYLDDLWLGKGSIAGAGTNLIQNGGFDEPLAGSWTLGTNHLGSAISTNFHHAGSGSLHLVASTGGYNDALSVWQDLPGINSGETYTLSYWVRSGVAATALVVRLEDWSLSSAHDLRAVKAQDVRATPGRINSTWTHSLPLPLLWLNEVQPRPLSGSAWVELLNAGTNRIVLTNYTLANGYSNPVVWAFPAGAAIDPGEFHLIWLDNKSTQSTATEWHASFESASGAGSLVLSRSLDGDQQVVDYLDYAALPLGASLGWAADGLHRDRVIFAQASPLSANGRTTGQTVVINEWMAANGRAVSEPADGGFEDWFELYNPGAAAVDLTGYALADSVTAPRAFILPPGTSIGPKGFLLVWADGHPERNQAGGDLHAPFKLSASGELILLTGPDGARADLVSFGQQLQDVSEGRWPDASSDPARRLTQPTPGAANIWANQLKLAGIASTVDGQLELAWASAAGQQFRLQTKAELTDPEWVDLGLAVSASGLETRVRLTAPGQAPHRFYRLVLVP